MSQLLMNFQKKKENEKKIGGWRAHLKARQGIKKRLTHFSEAAFIHMTHTLTFTHAHTLYS